MSIIDKWMLPNSGVVPTLNNVGNRYDPTLKNRFNIVGDRIVEVRQILVHRFKIGDVDDPEIYAAEPIYNWQQTDAGKWVMSHAVEPPVWHRYHATVTYDYEYAITAKLTAKDITYFWLKWGEIK